jgi:hypothetical protein
LSIVHILFFLLLTFVDLLSLLLLELFLLITLFLMSTEHFVEIDIVKGTEGFDFLREKFILGGEVQCVGEGLQEDAQVDEFLLDFFDVVDEGDHFGFALGEDVEFDEDDPEVEKLVLLLSVLDAECVELGNFQPFLVQLASVNGLLCFLLHLLLGFLQILGVLVLLEIAHVLPIQFIECLQHQFLVQFCRIGCEFLVGLERKEYILEEGLAAIESQDIDRPLLLREHEGDDCSIDHQNCRSNVKQHLVVLA